MRANARRRLTPAQARAAYAARAARRLAAAEGARRAAETLAASDEDARAALAEHLERSLSEGAAERTGREGWRGRGDVHGSSGGSSGGFDESGAPGRRRGSVAGDWRSFVVCTRRIDFARRRRRLSRVTGRRSIRRRRRGRGYTEDRRRRLRFRRARDTTRTGTRTGRRSIGRSTRRATGRRPWRCSEPARSCAGARGPCLEMREARSRMGRKWVSLVA